MTELVQRVPRGGSYVDASFPEDDDPWQPTARLRLHRPARGSDAEIKLEQMWKHIDGMREWREVWLTMED